MNPSRKEILFVDDEPNILKGYERSAEAYEDEWIVHLASSAKEALEIMKNLAVDVVVTDMRMPGMDGKELLESVSRLHPEVVRFVLSGNTENLMTLQFTNLAHQFLTKPCDLSLLKNAVDKIFSLREQLANPSLVQMINGIRELPSPPAIFHRLIKEIESENSTSKAIAELISQDMALTAKILQITNSAFIGISEKIVDPQRAVTVLGFNTIKALVLSIHVFSEAENFSLPAIPVDKLWRHSMVVGSLSRLIAEDAGQNQQMQNNAQITGLMLDIGKLLMLRIPTTIPLLKRFSRELTISEEYDTFGSSHAEMGAYLLGIWGLPFEIIEATAFHHAPEKQPAREFNLTALVHIADGLYYKHASSNQTSDRDFLNIEYLNETGLMNSIDRWSNIADQLMDQTRDDQGTELE